LVNPGAWEIPNNGQADRCIEGRDILNNIPCDTEFISNELYNQFIGPNTIPSQTEPAIYAMVRITRHFLFKTNTNYPRTFVNSKMMTMIHHGDLQDKKTWFSL